MPTFYCDEQGGRGVCKLCAEAHITPDCPYNLDLSDQSLVEEFLAAKMDPRHDYLNELLD